MPLHSPPVWIHPGSTTKRSHNSTFCEILSFFHVMSKLGAFPDFPNLAMCRVCAHILPWLMDWLWAERTMQNNSLQPRHPPKYVWLTRTKMVRWSEPTKSPNISCVSAVSLEQGSLKLELHLISLSSLYEHGYSLSLWELCKLQARLNRPRGRKSLLPPPLGVLLFWA